MQIVPAGNPGGNYPQSTHPTTAQAFITQSGGVEALRNGNGYLFDMIFDIYLNDQRVINSFGPGTATFTALLRDIFQKVDLQILKKNVDREYPNLTPGEQQGFTNNIQALRDCPALSDLNEIEGFPGYSLF